MKEYYLVKYCYPNYCETQIINKKNYEHIKDKIGVIYNYITFEDITGKITKINKENLNFISLEKIIEKVE